MGQLMNLKRFRIFIQLISLIQKIKTNSALSIIFGAFAPIVTGISSGFYSFPLSYYLPDFFVSFLSIFLLAEGVRRFSLKMQEKISWLVKTKLRVTVQLTFSILYNALIVGATYYVYVIFYYAQNFSASTFVYFLISGFLLTLIFSALWNAYFFFEEWKLYKKKLEIANMEKVSAQLQTLKSNISPHFLFNSLSILKGLIDESSDASKTFIDEFSGIFRYNLNREDKELTRLRDELGFVDSYVHILKMRFKEGIKIKVDVSNDALHRFLPWSTMQLLIENCVKHNVITEDSPLKIEIYNENNYLIIQNNIKKRDMHVLRGGYGLNNLKKRYALFSSDQILVSETNEIFKVEIPLLSIEKYENSHY